MGWHTTRRQFTIDLSGICDGCSKEWFNHPVLHDQLADSKHSPREAVRKAQRELKKLGWRLVRPND